MTNDSVWVIINCEVLFIYLVDLPTTYNHHNTQLWSSFAIDINIYQPPKRGCFFESLTEGKQLVKGWQIWMSNLRWASWLLNYVLSTVVTNIFYDITHFLKKKKTASKEAKAHFFSYRIGECHDLQKQISVWLTLTQLF
jgi:hypothetical protein